MSISGDMNRIRNLFRGYFVNLEEIYFSEINCEIDSGTKVQESCVLILCFMNARLFLKVPNLESDFNDSKFQLLAGNQQVNIL